MGTAVTLVKDSPSDAPGIRPSAPATVRRRGRRENLAGYLFMSPWIAGFLLLTAGPMVASLFFAFTDYNLFDSPKWIGFDNFTKMFDDPRWQKSVEVTAKYVVIGTPLKLLWRSVSPCCWRRAAAARPSTGPRSTPRH